MSSAEACFVCDCCLVSSIHTPWGEVEGQDGRNYGLVTCGNCGVVTVYPSPSPEELRAFYSRDYSGKVKSGIVEGDRPAANLAAIEDAATRLRYVQQHVTPPGVRVLDVGCGHGFFLHAAQRAGFQATGVDIDADAIDYARRVLDSNVIELPIDGLNGLAGREYDLITFWQVLEHLPRPGHSVRQATHLLSEEGGVIAGSVPNLGGIGSRLLRKRWDLLVPPEHLTYFDEQSCRTMLLSSGLEPIFVGTVPLYASPYFKLGIRAAVMRAAERSLIPVVSLALRFVHRTMTLIKRHLVYRPLNAMIIALGLPGNSVFFVATRSTILSRSIPGAAR